MRRLHIQAITAFFSAPMLLAASPSVDQDVDVTITRVSPDPGVSSGLILWAVQVQGRFGQEERTYFIPFMMEGQSKPAVAQRCIIRWQRSQTGGLTAYGTSFPRGSRIVTGFSCEDDHGSAAAAQ